ncbi:uncharacterized protein LOC123009334 [Tribolium madens]|uniref:uncharacterized protein LOC123009334 n=1 Tax=Tribolium madens TaxID=41895 RepID=UPI001CF730E8|nr:uncharacterized protein LOC123009334 [Tribolium madens]XP_044261494.1 uncharacterized protein LOC123009334 [Tribolium madens]
MAKEQTNIKCCIPCCRDVNQLRHVAYYAVRPQWLNTILTYLNSIQKNTNIMRLRSEFICSRHYNLSGIRDYSDRSIVYFPFLRISVNRVRERLAAVKKVRNICDEWKVYTSDELVVAREEVYPISPVKPLCIKEKKINPPKFKPDCYDHNYALTLDYVEYLKDSHEKLLQENQEFRKRHIETLTDHNEEIKRLKAINHDLLSKLFRSPPKTGSSLKSILENEDSLKFYTGFPSRDSFFKFLDQVRTTYLSSDFRHQFNMDEQVILVLTRLRLGLQLQDLAHRCNISLIQVHKICSFWFKLLVDLFPGKPGANNRVIIQCFETFFEAEGGKKLYGRTKALIEISPDGYIENLSNLFATHVSDKDIIETCQKSKICNCEALNKAKAARIDLQVHIQRIVGCLKGFQILKGTFPTMICSLEQLNKYWRICCFLVNYLDPPEIVV